jgi:hypothetical protein
MSYHNLLSKTARACAAYIISSAVANAAVGQEPFANGSNVLPVKDSLDKQLDAGMVICDCVRWNFDEGNPGLYLVETRIVVKTPVAIQQQDETEQTKRISSEAFVAAVFDLFFTGIVQQDNTQLADDITSAARACAALDPAKNADLSQFKCDEIIFTGGIGDANQDGTFWEDVLNLTLYVRAVSDTEPPEPD